MTRSAKTFITIILTYGLRRAGFWFFGYDPFVGNALAVGIAIDILLWVMIFYAVSWVLEKMFPKQQS
jgi:hypothetical protein